MGRNTLALDPFQWITVWQCPDHRPDPAQDYPVFWADWPELLAQCRRAVARREEAYPQLVAKGMITADLAQADLAAWKLLVAEWEWITTGQGVPPCPTTLPARIAACELALERVEAELARNGRSHTLRQQFHLIQALIWHLNTRRFGAPAVHHWAELNRQLRQPLPPESDHLKGPLHANA